MPLAQGIQKPLNLLTGVKWSNAMDHNRIVTLHLDWAITSEQR